MELRYDYKTVFSTEFVPPHIFFRDSQLGHFIESMDKGWDHYYCEGAKSTGKTVTALKYLEYLEGFGDQHIGLYFRTQRSIIIDFRRCVENALKRRLTFREHPLLIFGDFPQKHIHIIIDDAQKIMHFRLFNDFLHSLYEACLENHKAIHLKVLGTTPYPTFQKHIRDDVQSRYQFKPLIFPFYSAPEIKEILTERLKLCGIEYDDGALNFVAAKVKRLVADLRLGFTILLNACQITQGQRITEDVITEAWEKTKTDYWIEELKEMDEHSQLLLFAATKLAVRNKGMTTLDVNNLYRKICQIKQIEPLYHQRTYYLISKLIETGWFSKLETISKGRKGKGMKLLYEMTPGTILKAFEKIWEGE